MPRGSFVFKHGHVAYQIDGDEFSVTMSISNIFLPNFVRVLTNKRKYIEQIFFLLLGSCPRGGTWGAGGGGGQKL